MLLTTYNHEQWITQAIESVLAQETTFSFELVIMEDCSTDNTRAIVIDYQRRYPERIRLFLPEENRGDNRDFITAWQTSQSEYVAWLDGDDYWTSPHKLQTQANFLDSRPDCAMCFHNVTVLYEDGSQKPWYPKRSIEKKELFTLDDLWEGAFVPGPSPMFRRGLIAEFPEWFYNENNSADWAVYILMAQQGKIGYVDELMGAYRVHSGGVWSGINKTEQAERVVEFYRNMNRRLDYEYRDIIDSKIAKRYRELELQSNGLHRALVTLNDARLVQRIRRLGRLTLPVRVRRWLWAFWRLQYRAPPRR